MEAVAVGATKFLRSVGMENGRSFRLGLEFGGRRNSLPFFSVVILPYPVAQIPFRGSRRGSRLQCPVSSTRQAAFAAEGEQHPCQVQRTEVD